MEKILIIEDDSMLRETTSDFLHEEGYNVICASNGLEGIHKALKDKPDLILCDISMDEMDGYEVFKTLMENERTAVIPFIFLTARSEKEDIRTGMLLGADDYITKPFEFDELLNAIRIRLDKINKLKKVTREFYTLFFANSLVGMFLLKNNTIELVNPKLAGMLGYSPSDITGMPMVDILFRDDWNLLEDKLEKCRKGIFKKFQTPIRLVTKSAIPVKTEFYGMLIEHSSHFTMLGIVKEQDADKPGAPELLSEETLDALVQYIIDRKYQLSSKQVNEITAAFNSKPKIEAVYSDLLTKRELEVLQLICHGFTTQEIADKLFISQRTVDSHRASLLQKTGSSNTAELIVYAIRNSLFTINN